MNRTADSHPNSRASDQSRWGRVKNWWGPGRGYRDIWLIITTGLVAIALGLAADRMDDTDKTRVETVEKVCNGQNANARGVNKAFDYISTMILAGVVLPGDEITKIDDRGTATKADDVPAEIKPGKLSQDFTNKYDYPTPQQRLAKANEQVSGLDKLNVPVTDCVQAVEDVKKNGAK